MAAAVKRQRGYSSPKRAEQARQTRREILGAAYHLLVERGYPVTTIESIASEAGVAVQTIYTAVGNKRAVLWAVLEATVAGDDEPRTLFDRLRDEVAGEPDVSARLRRAVAFARRIAERSADVHRIMRSAATTDVEVAAALDEAERRRYRDAGAIVRLIAGDTGFARGMDERTAADLWYALTGYAVYDLLTRERRWSGPRFEQWVARALEAIVP